MKGSNRRLKRVTLVLLCLFPIAGSFLYGFIAAKQELPPSRSMVALYEWARGANALRRAWYWIRGEEFRAGRWRSAESSGEGAVSVPSDEIERLVAIGYLSGVEQASGGSGVTRYDPKRAWPGFNLYASGHGPEALLVDMEGRVVHRWYKPFEEAFPQETPPVFSEGPTYFRKVRLLENGDLLAIFEGLGIIRIDRNSNLIWAVYNGAHHDLDIADNGDIYVLTRKARVVPSVHAWKPILEDAITVLSEDGKLLRSDSVLEAIQKSDFRALMDAAPESGDIFHTNAVTLLKSGRGEAPLAFATGDVLVSIPRLNALVVIDLNRNRVTWALAGMTRYQHDPVMLENGNLLVLDNRGHEGEMSRVLEIDPTTQSVVWGYYGDRMNGFLTRSCGTSQRLPNGNTLITESDAGRVFEVTVSGEVVWEFLNPHRVGGDANLVATVFEMIRIDPDLDLDWIEEATGPEGS